MELQRKGEKKEKERERSKGMIGGSEKQKGIRAG